MLNYLACTLKIVESGFLMYFLLMNESLDQRKNLVKKITIALFIFTSGVIIRYPFALMEGHRNDMKINQSWMKSATTLGFARSFDKQVEKVPVPVYGPVGIGAYALSGHLYKLLVSSQYDVIHPIHYFFTKLPSIIADFLIALFLFFILAEVTSQRNAAMAACFFLLHPIIWFISSFFGQTDSIFTFFLVASLYFLHKKMPALAFFLLTLGIFTKPQALIFLPIYALLLIQNFAFIKRAFLGAVTAFFCVIIPFVLNGNIASAFRLYTAALTRTGKYLAMPAFNMWWSFFGQDAKRISGDDLFLDLIQFKFIGMGIFLTLYSLILLSIFLHKRNKEVFNWNLIASSFCVTNLSFFTFATGIHGRYFYPYIIFGLICVFVRSKQLFFYIPLSLLLFSNLFYVLPLGPLNVNFFSLVPGGTVTIARIILAIVVILLCDYFRTYLVPPLRNLYQGSGKEGNLITT